MRGSKASATLLSLVALVAPTAATAATGGVAPPSPSPNASGGSQQGGTPTPAVSRRARLVRGVAHAPAGAPLAVVRAIRAGNKLRNKPYRYGGGHRSFTDTAYDCSGAVSFALHGGRLLEAPLNSTGFMAWGRAGKGRWITVYANSGHAYAVIAGLRFDTSGTGGRGPRWQVDQRDPASFVARHPAGL